MKKRFLAWLLVLCLLLSAVPFQARAAAVVASGTVNGFTWVVDDEGTMILVGTGHLSTKWPGTHSPWYPYIDMIQKLVVDDGITSFDNDFLSDFPNLTDLVLPYTLEQIDGGDFLGCQKLNYLTVDFQNPYFFCLDNVLYTKDQSTLIFCPKGFTGVFTVPSGVKTIGRHAFSGCKNLTEVKYQGRIQAIDDRAFYECTKLETMTLPVSLTEIGASALEGTGLKTITIPGKVETIGSYALDRCEKLASIQVSADNPYFSSDGLALFNKDQTKLLQFPRNCVGVYYMPDTVVEFTSNAFWYNNKVSGVVLSENLKMIPDKAFKGCSSVYGLDIPHTVQTIGKEIFDEDSGHKTVHFAGSAPAIPNGAPFHDPNGTVFQDPNGNFFVTAYYPKGDQTWTAATRKAYGGVTDWRTREAMTDFGDVVTYHWYFEPILWAVEKGITSGTSATTFSPNNICQRAQVVTFLWRAAGSPRPRNTRNPFVDVKRTDFYYNPVLWAVEKGITNGTSASTFGSLDNCNRAAVVTFLWRACGSPAPKNTKNPFVDVKTTDFYYKPVLWAIEKGITNGVDATHFGPTAACTRAQVVTFLYRAYDYL